MFVQDKVDEILGSKENLNSLGLTWSRRDLYNLNWKSYTEEQIHEILDLYYDTLNYSVLNFHKSDRSNEGGADLVATKNGESIAIAVKLKPKKDDYSQALELSERDEKRKIYYYVETPTCDFVKKIKRLNTVEFISINEFLKECFNKNPRLYFQLVISNNSDFDQYLTKSKYILLSIWKNGRLFKGKNPTKRISRESFKELWRLKDISVELHKSASNCLTFYENKKIVENNEDEARLFLSIIKQFELSLTVLPLVLDRFYLKNKKFVDYNAKVNTMDSDWFSFARTENLSASGIDSFILTYKDEKKKWADSILANDINHSNLDEIFCDILRPIYGFGQSLEFRVDNFFDQAIGAPFARGKR